jgi:hypothetical protein
VNRDKKKEDIHGNQKETFKENHDHSAHGTVHRLSCLLIGLCTPGE